MNELASTYAALFDAVAASDTVKTASAEALAAGVARRRWPALVGAGLGGLGLGLGAHGLYRLLSGDKRAPAKKHLAVQPQQIEEAYTPETDYAYEGPDAGTYGYYPGADLGYTPYGVDPGTGYAPYEGWWY